MAGKIFYKLIEITDNFETKSISPQIVKIGDEYLYGTHELSNQHNEIITKVAIFENNDNNSNVNKRVYVIITNKLYYRLFSSKYLPDNIIIAPDYYFEDNIRLIYSDTKLQSSVIIIKKINEYVYNGIHKYNPVCTKNYKCVCFECMKSDLILDTDIFDQNEIKKLLT